jgi:hypothetical protein
MGTAELNISSKEITIFSWLITYGSKATPELTEQMREEIEGMWNEPSGFIVLQNEKWSVRFRTSAYMRMDIQPEDIISNVNPKNNYIRIEEYSNNHISFVDGLGCNTGYWKLDNLYKGSTTAAHEYGHTLGLPHPVDMDYRGKGAPGIMYPRGTLVDPEYQYEADKPAGTKGGTMHPMHRKVRQADIEMLNLHKLSYTNNIAIVGDFTAIWHPEHKA